MWGSEGLCGAAAEGEEAAGASSGSGGFPCSTRGRPAPGKGLGASGREAVGAPVRGTRRKGSALGGPRGEGLRVRENAAAPLVGGGGVQAR